MPLQSLTWRLDSVKTVRDNGRMFGRMGAVSACAYSDSVGVSY